MKKKSRYTITFFQLELLEALENTQELSAEILKEKLNTTISAQEISRNLGSLIMRGYLTSRMYVTKKGKRIIEEYYSNFDENVEEGFAIDRGICDQCKKNVDCRIKFKKEKLCRDCLNP